MASVTWSGALLWACFLIHCVDTQSVCSTDDDCPTDLLTCETGSSICQRVSCTDDTGCTMSNAHCDITEGRCACKNGFSLINGACQEILGQQCVSSNDCEGTNYRCSDGECQCSTRMWVEENGVCVSVFGRSCLNSSDCGSNTYTSVECRDSVCTCRRGYMEENNYCRSDVFTKNRKHVSVIGRSCTSTEDCPLENAVCEGRCRCLNGTTRQVIGPHTCDFDLGKSCFDYPCGFNMYGTTIPSDSMKYCNEENICSCRIGYVESNHTCISAYNKECNDTLPDCGSDIMYDCQDLQCQCAEGFVNGKDALLRTICVKELGQPCTHVSCSFANSTCDDLEICSCISGYKEHLGQCLPVIGSECSRAEDCSRDPNAVCDTNCRCRAGFEIIQNVCLKIHGKSCTTDADCDQTTHLLCEGGVCSCDSRWPLFKDQCLRPECHVDVKELPNLEWRSLAQQTHAFEVSLDDSTLEPRWYNLKTYSISPTSDNIKTGSCGTLYPIYLKEPLSESQLEQLVEGSIRTQVAVGGVDLPWKREIGVELRICGDDKHILIENPPPKLSAICIDTSNKTRRRYATYNAWISPELRFYEEERDGIVYDVPFIHWKCRWPSSVPNITEAYVTWNVDKNVFIKKGTRLFSDWNVLTEMELIERNVTTIGFTLQCLIELSDQYGKRLYYFQSDPIVTDVFQGYSVVDWVWILAIRPDNFVAVSLPSPLGCAKPVGDMSWNCSLYFGITAENGTSMCRSNVTDPHQKCGILFLGTTRYGLENRSSSRNAVLQAFIDLEDTTENGDQKINKEVKLNLGKPTSSPGHALWQNYQYPVTSLPWRGSSMVNLKYCFVSNSGISSYGTFGIGSTRFHFPDVGTYLLYRNNEYPVEVHVHTEGCATSNGICACGATVRNDDLIFTEYYCRGSHISGTIADSISSRFDKNWNNRKLLDGSRILVRSNNDVVAIEMVWTLLGKQTPRSILDLSEGLCSSMDNEYRKRDGTITLSVDDYARSWIVKDEDLLNPATHMNYTWNEQFYPCDCPSKSEKVHGHIGFLKCTLGNICMKEHQGQVAWPSTLRPDYAISEVNVRQKMTEHPETALRCVFTGGSDSFRYRLKWKIDERILNMTGLISHTDTHVVILEDLTTDDEYTILDAEIVCGVAVYSVTGDPLTDFYYSKVFKSVEITNSVVKMIRGADVEIRLLLHVHLTFGRNLQFSLFDPDNTYDCSNSTIAVRSKTSCGQVYSGSNHQHDNDANAAYTISIPITTINDNNYSLKERFTLRVHVKSNGNAEANVLTGYFKEKVTVIVSDVGYWRRSHCYVINDPRFRTFDRLQYSNQLPGEFRLWRHTHLQAEIQIQTRMCGRGSCSCGVSVRAGRDIFVINHCSSGDHIIGFIQNGDNVLIVRKWNENSYQIHFPHGTFVEVYVSRRWSFLVNVYIYPSPRDVGQVEGLCGNLNGDYSDDLRHRDGNRSHTTNGRWWLYSPDQFVASWQLDRDKKTWETDSLLNPNRTDKSFQSWYHNKEQTLCVCPYGGNDIAVCSTNEERTCIKDDRSGVVLVNTKRRSRSVDGSVVDMTDRLRRMRQEMTAIGIMKREVRGTNIEDSNLTYAQALEYCNETLMSDCPMSFIKNETSANDLPVVEECAKDLLLNPNVPWAEAECKHLSSVIAATVSRDTEFKENHPETTAFIRELDRCKGNCSNNGHCIGEEECSCFEGFGSNDCSLDLTVPVEILSTQGGGVCNEHVYGDCSQIRVTTRGHLSSAKCKIAVKKASIGHSFEKATDETNENCGCPHMYDIYCCWDMANVHRKLSTRENATVYQVGFSISNDGVLYGSMQYVFILHTLCQEVIEENGLAIARLKSGYCFIDGACYSKGDISTSNPCKVCQPSNSLLNWTTSNCSSTGTGKETSTITIALVSIFGGIAIVSFVIAFIVVVVKKHKPTRNTVADGQLVVNWEDGVLNQNSNLGFEMTEARKDNGYDEETCRSPSPDDSGARLVHGRKLTESWIFDQDNDDTEDGVHVSPRANSGAKGIQVKKQLDR